MKFRHDYLITLNKAKCDFFKIFGFGERTIYPEELYIPALPLINPGCIKSRLNQLMFVHAILQRMVR